MRNAKTILQVIRDRGRKRRPLTRVYRLLYNPNLSLLAYARIARNDGALTPGVTQETADGMCLDTIQQVIAALRAERYRWTPVRRVYIEKKGSTARRPLGIPTWTDKLLQEVLRLILEAYDEPQCSPPSHGFRAGRGCHTALRDIKRRWKGTKWFIEGDISRGFDSLDHTTLLSTLGRQIHDGRFLRLLKHLLRAGYLEDWTYHATLSGTPQGGVVSPILANIYLHELDQFVEDVLLPAYNRGTVRRENPAYKRLRTHAARLKQQGRLEEAMALRRHMQTLPYGRPADPEFRRLYYVRYADDFLLGFAGPRAEAETITGQLGTVLLESFKLTLSEAKTVITHARTEAAHFLGYDIVAVHDDQKRNQFGHRHLNGKIGLQVPAATIREQCRPYMAHGKPIHRVERMVNHPYSMVADYHAEYRGIVGYYRMADNLHRLNRLQWAMATSLLKTLAAKFGWSVRQVLERYKPTHQPQRGPKILLPVTVERGGGRRPLVARWGGISLRHTSWAVLKDRPQKVWNERTDLVERVLAATCELCGSQAHVQVHHVRRLSNLRKGGRNPKPAWTAKMIARQRKTLVVCRRCHYAIHAGRLETPQTMG
jgi:group II intron reverse transcriptase/maturase